MLRRLSRILLPAALVTLVAPLAWSRPPADSNREVSEIIRFSHATRVNGKIVPSAEYRIVAGGKELKVQSLQTGKTVADSPITWKYRKHRFHSTRMDIDHGVLTKVNLGGTRDAVLLHHS